jgi:hypothetical protein
MNVTDTKQGPCILCRKQKEVTLFCVQGNTYKGWCCADHLAGFIEQLKSEKKEQP